jgi:putative ABC transport system permease protein
VIDGKNINGFSELFEEILRGHFYFKIKNKVMIKNYFKIAWRNLLKNKTFSLINIAGLAIGISTCLIIMLFVYDEWRYDKYNEKADQIVRVVLKGAMSGEQIKEAFVMAPVAQTLKKEYPEVVDATRIREYGTPKVTLGDKTFKNAKFAFVDDNFFQVFTLPLIKGDAKTALLEPNTIVITQSLAHTYFGNEDPMGKMLELKELKQLYKITGVAADVPTNSHFHFDHFASMESHADAKSDSWMSGSFHTYLVLQKGFDFRKLEAKLPLTVDKYMDAQLKAQLGMNMKEFREKGNSIGFALQPLTDIHLQSTFSTLSNFEPSGDIRYVYIFSAVALFMLLIACINFMNLSTASASKRAKEVGIRKVLGSIKSNLISQFMIESVVLTFISLLLALVLVKSGLPLFNSLADKKLTFQTLIQPSVALALLGFGLFIGLVAGSYPAFYLSSFKPIAVLKTKFAAKGKGLGLRSGLVVFQFIISVILIVGTTVVYQQLAFIQNKKLGYDKDQLLVLRNTYLLGKNENVLKQNLLQDPRVASVTTSAFTPAGPTDTNMSGSYPDENSNHVRRTILYQVDDKYIPTMGMEMKKGRNFSKDLATDSSGVIINEALAKNFGWGESALGHIVNRLRDTEGGTKAYKVIGMVKDFHFKTLHEEIAPMMMVLEESHGLIIKVKTKDVSSLLTSIKTEWEKFNTEEPFSYAFIDELFYKTYTAEQKTGTILFIFAGLTIFIACLGLFGLATFTAEQRTKEIGIRKVLGASVPNIIALLSKEFIVLVSVAILIATPIAWWAMTKWLQDFAYRITINVWIFVLAGVMALLIALLTVSFQAIKAAVANPVKSLRTE